MIIVGNGVDNIINLVGMAFIGETWGCPNFIRIIIGTFDENQKFIYALKEVISEKR